MKSISRAWLKVRENTTPIQLIVCAYFGLIIITFALLSLPFFRNPTGVSSPLDTFFMAVSTVSVTGLTTVPINEVYNNYGVVLLEILFQVGGLGVTMLATVGMIFTRRRISLHQRQLIQVDMNQPRLSGTVRLVYSVFGLMMALQLFFGIIFAGYFYLKSDFLNFKEALFEGFYTSITAVTNAGFDITGSSLHPYRHDYLFLFFVIVLIIVGGIGFPVLAELREWFLFRFNTKKSGRFQFSLFVKLAVFFAALFFVLGAVLIFLAELQGKFASQPLSEKVMTALFYSASTRNAGLQLDALTDFRPVTLLLFSLLMFIGASPSSVGGGVRTTTIGILLLYLYSFIRGRKDVNIFGRRIGHDDIQKAVVVVNLSLLLCGLAVLLLAATEKQSLTALIFEVASAFGTTGLSLGITGSLSVVGKIVIIVLMFIGRVGMLYMLMLFISKKEQEANYMYPVEQVIIG
ncbi:TrkH family potassium uptake protein [Liquorilactobacillus satsumensis]|uniref:TrkH family potassium uptake protein n=1 Tax=Liquorilactobacillus satsumensis TaxID=259059 RepID=UPI0021C429E9|nr:potassium transporter TrkG [Liquorilactobacillus satsumensis]MCP9312226.1 TrkH family potassium uptake protein [Liquorilactobacillus satsumensis]MCP9328730.1 TrkH family potassium uptake protein [Liquorilactobacillus satsumensis]MCP9359505.1 TrkH family potassium uptake protein [Liquorilactobacillus satsumensis]